MEAIRRRTSGAWLAGTLAATLCALIVPAAAHATFINDSTSGGPVTINDVSSPPTPGLATPYPSTILVEGGDGPILDVDVHVNGVTHNSAADIDLVLVSPSGATSILMSDACGANTTITNLNFTFDDTAPLPPSLPNSGCASGTFTTTDNPPSDNWPAPGPGTAPVDNLDNFNGRSADGTWQSVRGRRQRFPVGIDLVVGTGDRYEHRADRRPRQTDDEGHCQSVSIGEDIRHARRPGDR